MDHVAAKPATNASAAPSPSAADAPAQETDGFQLVIDALKLSAEVTGNYYYERLWYSVLDQVTTGNQICDALKKNSLFPRVLVQMISSGEETGKLDEVLLKVSNYYDQEVETSLKTVTSMIEPLMIGVMGVIVGGIGMGMLLPIFSLSKTPG